MLAAALVVLTTQRAQADPSPPPTVPFAFLNHEVLVQVRIGNAGPYTFMLDSDTDPSIIDIGLARRLRLPIQGPSGRGSGIGSQPIAAVPLLIPDVRVGTVHVARLQALATNLSRLSKRFGRRLDGVLGTSFLTERVVRIDYACQTVSFLPDAILAPFSARFNGADGVPGSGDNLTNDVWVGSKRVIATFDTGDSGSSLVPAKGITDLGLSRAVRAGQAATTAGFGSSAPAVKGTLPNVRIGHTMIGPIKTQFIPSAGASDVPYDLNIGNQTLSHFVVVLDYQRGLVTLLPPTRCEGKNTP